jgi:PhzF family phenazine biosynthesis protein
MKIKMYQVDAFSDKIFKGNPAAVCILEKWIDDDLMQKIAQENNLSETAFVVKKNKEYEIRWLTPEIEVELCGHATLASAHVLFNYYIPNENEIIFISKFSGILKVKKEEDFLILDFPIGKYKKINSPKKIIEGLGKNPIESYKGKTDYMFVYKTQQQIQDINPDFQKLMKFDVRGIIVTSKGNKIDFVSRFFAPGCGINEDPVTGSAHTMLTPYWIKRLKKKKLEAIQLSKRMGKLICSIQKDRVKIAGKAKTYLIGEIIIPD